MFGLNKLLAKVVIILVVIIGGYVALAFMYPDLNFLAPKPLKLKDTAVIIEESKSIAQLFSATYYAEVVIDTFKREVDEYVDAKNTGLAIFTFGLSEYTENTFADTVLHEFTLIGKGKCYAGNDLSNLSPSDIIISGDTSCTIKVPKATIFNTVINPSEFEIFIDENGFTPEEVQGIKQVAVDKIKRYAIESGIIEKADKRTEKLLIDFLKSLGFATVKVEFV